MHLFIIIKKVNFERNYQKTNKLMNYRCLFITIFVIYSLKNGMLFPVFTSGEFFVQQFCFIDLSRQ